jgi:hypothetical protein
MQEFQEMYVLRSQRSVPQAETIEALLARSQLAGAKHLRDSIESDLDVSVIT